MHAHSALDWRQLESGVHTAESMPSGAQRAGQAVRTIVLADADRMRPRAQDDPGDVVLAGTAERAIIEAH